MKHIVYGSVLVFALLTQPCVASNWPQFRGPGGSGQSDEKNLPTTWSEQENLVWKAALPGYGASSPITLGERLYVTCYSGYGVDRANSGSMEDLMLHVVCLSKSDGKIVWDTHVEPKLPETRRVNQHGYAAATPATDGENLYVFFGKSGVFAFDLDGTQLWNADLGSGTHRWGCGTSPVLYKNLVIVNASVESGSLVAVDKKSGQEVWRAGGMQRSWNTPHLVSVADGKQELVVSVRGSVLGFDPATGDQLWRCEGIPDYVCPSVVSRDGIVYVIGGRRSLSMAIRAGGRGEVTDSHKIWQQTAGANVSSPVIYKDHLYWVSDRNRTAYCLRLDNGEIVFQRRFSGQPYASSIVGDGKLYVQTRYDGTFVLAAKPEFEQLAQNRLEDRSTFNASPIISGGRIFLRSDKYLYCIGKKG